MELDAVIVGGSFAGLSAALQLARARRRIAVVDAGVRRNRFASHSHGFLAQDGRPPGEIVEEARRQLLRYPTVRWVDAQAENAAGTNDAFEVATAQEVLRARRIVLAMGVSDGLPEVPGLRERWGRTVFHCPYCHGYELRNGRIGVLATGPASIHQALLLPDWGAVTFFLNGAFDPSPQELQQLAQRGVRVEAAAVLRISGDARVHLRDGREVEIDGIFTASRTAPASPLAAQLGCAHEEGPLGPFVATDAQKATSVPGVFACGDLARGAGNIALAVGDGVMAGTATHRSLVFPA